MKNYVTLMEAARLVNRERSVISKQCKKNNIISKKINNKWMVSVESLLRHYNINDVSEIDDDVIVAPKDDFLGNINKREVIKKDIPLDKPKYYIITAAQNNTSINKDFFANVLAMKEFYKAELIISRLTYNKTSFNKARQKDSVVEDTEISIKYPSELTPYLCDDYLELADDLVYLGFSDKLITSPNPLASSHHNGWNKSFIIPHTRRQLETYPLTYAKSLNHVKEGCTTGVITNINYIQNESGHKAELYHHFGVVLVKVLPNGKSYTYQICASRDGNFSICHLDIMFIGGKVLTDQSIKGLVLGDIHGSKLDKTPIYDKFFGKNNIFNEFSIEKVVSHDTHDQSSQNHHIEKNNILNYVQYHTKEGDIFGELVKTVGVLNSIRNIGNELLVVESNHDNHLAQYLNGKWRLDDHVNKLANLWLNVIEYTGETSRNNIITPMTEHCIYEPFLQVMKDTKLHEGNIYEFVARKMIGLKDNITFIDEKTDVHIMNFLVNLHGDKGVNGTRSGKSLRKMSEETIIGHIHSPCIVDFLTCVGVTPPKEKFKYASSPSSWANAFAFIYANGTTSLCFYKHGNFK